MKKLLFLLFVFALTVSSSYAQFTLVAIDPPIVRFTVDSSNHADTMQVRWNGSVNNTSGAVLDTVKFIISNESLQNGWDPAGICTWITCFAPGQDTVYAASVPTGMNNFDVYFTPHFHIGQSTCTITAKYHNFSQSMNIGAAVDPLAIHQISAVVHEFSLSQNFPNPFNPSTKINFTLPKSEYTFLRIYDILGREVKTLVNGPLNAGEYQVDFDAKDLASGMYYYSLRAGENVTVKKMVLVK